MAINYEKFLPQNKQTKTTKTKSSGIDYEKFLPKEQKKETTKQPETFSSGFRTVKLTPQVGGGEYKTAGPGSLILTPRGYAGITTQKGSERDHIIPVALGGNSSKENIQLLSSNKQGRQSGKLSVEQLAIKDYSEGKISLPEARLRIMTANQKIKGLIPPQGYWNQVKQNITTNLGQRVKETVINPITQGVKETGNFIKTLGSEAIKNPKEIFKPKDVVSGIKEIGTIGKTIVQATPRAAVSVGLDALNKNQYTPKNKVAKTLLGSEPIKSAFTESSEVQKWIEKYAEKYGASKFQSKGLGLIGAPLFVGFMKGLDLSPVGGGKKTLEAAAVNIAKTESLPAIRSALKTVFKEATPQELEGLANSLVKITDPNKVKNIIKSRFVSGEAKSFAPELKELEETVKGARSKEIQALFAKNDEAVQKASQEKYGKSFDELTDRQQSNLINNSEAFKASIEDTTKYSQYQLPNGKNYKEILIKAPNNAKAELEAKGFEFRPRGGNGIEVVKNGGRVGVWPSIDSAVNAQSRLTTTFKSSHWDELNVISHLRLNERNYKGKKVTFMEELQSDWAREARTKDVRGDVSKWKAERVGTGNTFAVYDEFGKFLENQPATTASEAIAIVNGGRVPSNPNLKNWQELSIKRALKEAVDNDSAYLAWTTGEQQAARYNLAKEVESIKWEPEYSVEASKVGGRKAVRVTPKNSGYFDMYIDKNNIVQNGTYKGKKIDEVIGKGISEKIATEKSGELKGEGLNIGGEWAKNLYDKQVKNIVEKLTGSKVEVLDMGLGTGGQQAIKITPEIKALVRDEALKIKTSGKMLGDIKKKTDILTNAPTRPAISETKQLKAQDLLGRVKEKTPTKLSDSEILRQINSKKRESFIKLINRKLAPLRSEDKQTQDIFNKWSKKQLIGNELANEQERNLRNIGGKVDDILSYEAGKPVANRPVIQKVFDDLHAEAEARGLDFGYRKNYLPQAYSNKPEEVANAVAKYMKDGGVDDATILGYLNDKKELSEEVANTLKLNPSFTRERVFPDYKTAIKYGLKPKYENFGQLAANYRLELEKTIANKELLDELVSQGKITDIFGAGRDYKAISLPFSRQGYYAPPKLANMINGIFRDEANLGLGERVLKGMGWASRRAQEVVLSAGIPKTNINFFAMGQLIKNLTAGEFKSIPAFVRANFNNLSVKFFEKRVPVLKDMAAEGIDIGTRVGNYKQLYDKFSRNKGVLQNLGHGWNKSFNEKTFASFLPQMYVNTFENVQKKALKQGLDELTARKLAGDVTKKFYGLLENVGRSKTTEDALSAVFFAPKFRESILRTLFSTSEAAVDLVKNVGGLTGKLNPTLSRNRRLIGGLIISFAAYNALNKKLTGNYMWENPSGKEFDLQIPLPNRDYAYLGYMPSFLTVPRNIAGAGLALAKGDIKTAGQKVAQNLSMPLKLVGEVVSNQDYFGNPIYKENDSIGTKYKKIAEYIGLGINHPYVREVVKFAQGKQPLYMTISKMLEMPLKFQTKDQRATQEFYDALDRKEAEEQKIKEAFRPMYDEIQRVKLQSVEEADKMTEALTPEQYAIYKSLKRSDTIQKNKEENKGFMPMYLKIKALRDEGKIEEANAITSGLSPEDYEIYKRLKKQLE